MHVDDVIVDGVILFIFYNVVIDWLFYFISVISDETCTTNNIVISFYTAANHSLIMSWRPVATFINNIEFVLVDCSFNVIVM